MKIIFWAKKRRKKIDFHPQTLSLPIICRTRGRLDGNSDEESVKLWTSFFGLCERAREREKNAHNGYRFFFSVLLENVKWERKTYFLWPFRAKCCPFFTLNTSTLKSFMRFPSIVSSNVLDFIEFFTFF